MSEREEIERYYDARVGAEWARLDRRPVEFEMTKRHLDDLLPPACAVVDVGSGPGRYAIYLAERGHDVSLVDLSQNSLDRAAAEAARRGVRLRALHHLSAVDMPELDDESYDAVLCLGPLYHLTDEAQRRDAITECVRLLKVGGVAFFAFVTLYAHAVARIGNGALQPRPGEMDEYQYILRRQTNRDLNLVNFTHAWYVDPCVVPPLMEGFGLKTERFACLEPLGLARAEALEHLSPEERARWLEYLFQISTAPSILGASQHILYCCKKVGTVAA